MINAITYAEELEKVRFSAEQAKKSVDLWLKLMNDNFATKSDLKELNLELQLFFDRKLSKVVTQLGPLIIVVAGIGFSVLSFLISK